VGDSESSIIPIMGAEGTSPNACITTRDIPNAKGRIDTGTLAMIAICVAVICPNNNVAPTAKKKKYVMVAPGH
jgi:hypothetical protein